MISNVQKSCTVHLAVTLILSVLAETSSFPREASDQRLAVEYNVPTTEVEDIRDDRNSLRASKYRPADTKWKKVDKFRDHDQEDSSEARTGDKLNRLRRETTSSVDNVEARTSKSKADKKYSVASGTEKKGRNKMKMAQEHGETGFKRETLSGRVRRQTQKSEKVDKYVREMGFYVPKAKADCGSRGDKWNCGVKRVQRDAVFTKQANSSALKYYSERRKVMERYYARQREILDKYKRVSSTPRSVSIRDQTEPDLWIWNPVSTTSNSHTVRTTTIQSTTSSSPTSRTAFDNDVRITLLTGNETSARRKHEERFWSHIPPTDGNPYNVDVKISPVFPIPTPDEYVQEGIGYNSTRQNCSLYGGIKQKTKSKKQSETKHATDYPRNDSTDGDKGNTWGNCSGQLVYQHNLLLGLRGPSTLNAMIEVIINAPVCITCVTAQRFNQTRAIVTKESGGHGYNFVKLKLIGFGKEGFSYILQIYGRPKTGDDCK